MRPNAVELTVGQAWFVAEAVGAGAFPWVLAITPPYRDEGERRRFDGAQRETLQRMGAVAPNGSVEPAVAEWIRIVCYCERWLDLRYVRPPAGDLLRGVIARRGERTVVALRNAQLVTFTAMTVDHPETLVPIVLAGLAGRRPADFDEFALPAAVGARADDRLRNGADLGEVLTFLGIPATARPVVESLFVGPRSYVEIVAGQRRDGAHTTTEVGVSVVDAPAGRILISPHRAPDGEWVSTFTPATSWVIAVALDRLMSTLPDGQWFPGVRLTRDFVGRPA